jgi:tetratricopeptide (TPR) repeat protein
VIFVSSRLFFEGKKLLSKFALLSLLCALCLVSEAWAKQTGAAQSQRYLQEGEKALAEGRYDEAARAYEKLRELAPNMAEARARLGLIYYQQGKFEEAARELRQAIKLKPGLPNTGLLLAMALSELGQYKEAAPALEKGFKSATDPALKRASGLRLSRAYTGLGQDDKAVEVALELTRLYPKDPEILYQAARLFANYAYLSTVKLAEVAPDSLWMSLAAGEAYESQGRPDAALREYKKALSLRPNRPGVHYRIGRALLQIAKGASDGAVSESEALAAFEHELRLDPTNANAAYEAGEIHRRSARYDRAADLFSQAVKYYPEFGEALAALGRTLVSLGRAEQALAPLTKAIALDAENQVAWFQLAQAQRALGNAAEQQKAMAEFQRLRDLDLQARKSALKRREVTQQSLDAKPPRE